MTYLRRSTVLMLAAVAAVLVGANTLRGQESAPAAAPVAAPAAVSGGAPRSPFPNETPEQRLARIGTQEDPGPNPDATTKWVRFGREYTIDKFPKKKAAFDQKPGWCRPLEFINIPAEIYQENDEWVWVWLPEIAPEETRLADESLDETKGYINYTPEQRQWLEHVRPEFAVVTPADSGVTLTFQNSSTGLPVKGSWRNGLDVADINEDGFLDILAPPQRGGASASPSIFLGDGQGGWKYWAEVKWPAAITYGTVAAGDLNKDGHLDVVAFVHLKGIKAFLGDGKGNFTDASEGLPDDFPTRRGALVDLDADGDLDIVGLSEGAAFQDQVQVRGSLLRGYLNEKGAAFWKQADIADEKRQVAGDWLAVGNFNGDKYPDVAGSSIFFNATDTIYLSKKKGEWTPFGRGWLPFYSYYWAVTSGRFRGRKSDDLVVSYGRTWPDGANPKFIPAPEITRVLGIDLISFDGKEPKRTPIVRWESRRAIFGLGRGDFDKDGNLDLVYWHPEPYEFVFLLGDGKGGFRKAAVEGIAVPEQTLYDIKVADVDRDGFDDLLLMYEAAGTTKDGSIQVYRNLGAAAKKALASGGR